MANDKSIEQQVAELSVEQQNKILKTGKIAVVMEIIVAIPAILWMLLGMWVLIDPPLGFDYANYDEVFTGFITGIVFFVAVFVGILVAVKLACPYYSDAKWKCINNQRKGK